MEAEDGEGEGEDTRWGSAGEVSHWTPRRGGLAKNTIHLQVAVPRALRIRSIYAQILRAHIYVGKNTQLHSVRVKARCSTPEPLPMSFSFILDIEYTPLRS